jgi:hypothetical protein
MVLKHVEDCGPYKIYKDEEGREYKMLGYKGFEHPRTKEEVVPKLQTLLIETLKNLNKYKENGVTQLDINETMSFLGSLLEFTEPEVGYFFCPYPVLEQVPIITKYGRKLLDMPEIEEPEGNQNVL